MIVTDICIYLYLHVGALNLKDNIRITYNTVSYDIKHDVYIMNKCR